MNVVNHDGPPRSLQEAMCLRDPVRLHQSFRPNCPAILSEDFGIALLQWLPLVGQRAVVFVEHRTVQGRSSERKLREGCVHGGKGGGTGHVLHYPVNAVFTICLSCNIPRLRPRAAVKAPQHIGRWPKTSSRRTLSLNWSRSNRMRDS